jgi:hypothetical protein
VLSLAVIGALLFAPLPSVAEDDQPTIARDSLQVTAFTLGVYRGDYDKWSWVPKALFRVSGPIASGSQLSLSFAIPGGAAVTFDCPTSETQKGRFFIADCGGRDVPEDKASLYTGPVSFSINLRNELMSANSTLFTGRIIFPVQILGDQDGQWNRTAWKTDAFYGHPLTGFAALP